MKILNLLVVGMFLFATQLLSADADDFNYQLRQITDKIYVIFGPLELPDKHNRGFRNNVVVIDTGTGVVVMDPGGSAWSGEKVAEKIGSILQKPVVAVFNSHAHGDHWLGNEGIKRHYPNAIIYGHTNMKKRVEGYDGSYWLDTINRITENTADGNRVVAPDRTVNDGDVITVGDTGFRIIHTGKAHTDNDIMIEIVGEDALFTGDVVRNHFLGIMEDDSSFKGNIQAIDKIAAGNYSYYIPGHGSIGDAGMAISYKTYLSTLRAAVKEMFDAGITDYEMKPEITEALADFNSWTGFEQRLGAHISRAYLEVEQEDFE